MKHILAIALVLGTSTATVASDDWLGGLERTCAQLGFTAGEVYQESMDQENQPEMAKVKALLTGKCMMDAAFVTKITK